jgi:hypothetical protein
VFGFSRHRTRNTAIALAVLLISVAAPFTISRGNRIVGGNTTLYALWVCAALALVVWALCTDTLARRLPFVWTGWSRGTLSAAFDHHHGALIVTVDNEGLTLRDAGVTVYIPKSVSGPWWTADKEHNVRGEAEYESDESLSPEHVGCHVWHGKGFHILGGGIQPTSLWWRVNGTPGRYPVRFRVYDDADAPRSLDTRGVFEIHPREINRPNGLRLAGQLLEQLDWNHKQLVRALSSGDYLLSQHGDVEKDGYLRVVVPATVRAWLSDVAPDGAPELVDLVSGAFGESERIKEIAAARIRDGWDVRDDDRVEQALVAIYIAEAALRREVDRGA